MMFTVQKIVVIPLSRDDNLILAKGEHVRIECRTGVEGTHAKRYRLMNRLGRPLTFITKRQLRAINRKAYDALVTE